MFQHYSIIYYQFQVKTKLQQFPRRKWLETLSQRKWLDGLGLSQRKWLEGLGLSQRKWLEGRAKLHRSQEVNSCISIYHNLLFNLIYFDKINNHYIPSNTGGCQGFCLTVLRPVCGSDGKTYTNLCELKSAKKCDSTLTLQHHGECRKGNSSSILKIVNVICRNWFIIYNFLFFWSIYAYFFWRMQRILRSLRSVHG